MPFTITNNGPEIKETSYWSTNHADAGLCYLSGNAGALRLLIPKKTEHILPEMRTGTRVTIEHSMVAAGNLDLVFEDGTDSPLFLSISHAMVDHKLRRGRGIPFSVWTESGKVMSLRCNIKVN